MKKFLLTVAVLFNLMGAAQAQGFNEWVAVGDEGEDPFAEFKEIVFGNIKGWNSAALFLSCREGKGELEIKAVSSFKIADMPTSDIPGMSFAIDGKILFKDREAVLNSNSSGRAMSYALLKGDEAQDLAQKFSEAQKSIAVRDGIGAETEIYSARGASSAGRKLLKCLLK